MENQLADLRRRLDEEKGAAGAGREAAVLGHVDGRVHEDVRLPENRSNMLTRTCDALRRENDILRTHHERGQQARASAQQSVAAVAAHVRFLGDKNASIKNENRQLVKSYGGPQGRTGHAAGHLPEPGGPER